MEFFKVSPLDLGIIPEFILGTKGNLPKKFHDSMMNIESEAFFMATNQQVIQDIKRVIGLIRTDIHDLSQEEKNQMVQDTIEHFNHYVSPGWLKYRKSVSSDSDSGAVLEWQDEGAYCYGLNGEKFIDCLGGFGIYTCGHRNPEILDVVKAQLDHQALHSQELLDPLRGYLAKAIGEPVALDTL